MAVLRDCLPNVLLSGCDWHTNSPRTDQTCSGSGNPPVCINRIDSLLPGDNTPTKVGTPINDGAFSRTKTEGATLPTRSTFWQESINYLNFQ